MAGGGTGGGRVVGSSDKNAAYPRELPVSPADVQATIYHALGIDRATSYRDTLDRPRQLTEHGGPVTGLF